MRIYLHLVRHEITNYPQADKIAEANDRLLTDKAPFIPVNVLREKEIGLKCSHLVAFSDFKGVQIFGRLKMVSVWAIIPKA